MKKFHRFLVSGVILLGFNGLVPNMPSTLISQRENLVHAAVLGDNYPSKWKKAMESIRGTCISANALLLQLFV